MAVLYTCSYCAFAVQSAYVFNQQRSIVVQNLFNSSSWSTKGLQLAIIGLSALICLQLWSSVQLLSKDSAKQTSAPVQNLSANRNSTSINFHELAKSTMFGSILLDSNNSNNIPDSHLALILQGILHAKGKQSHAVIASPGERAKVYYVGEQLPGGAKLQQILEHSVIIARDGELEKLSLPEHVLELG